jgi:hypothetical protein
MARDDELARRRLRQVYQQNRKRVNNVAAARERGREGDSKAPRRFVVAERQSRVAGIGGGRVQVAESRRKQQQGAKRFKDQSVFKNRNRRGDNNRNAPRAGGNVAKRAANNNKQGNNNARRTKKPRANRKADGKRGNTKNAGARPPAEKVEDAFARYLSGQAAPNTQAVALDQQLQQYKSGVPAPVAQLDQQLQNYFGN